MAANMIRLGALEEALQLRTLGVAVASAAWVPLQPAA